MNYHHFTIEERCCLREYYIKGKSYREIARLLGRSVSSVSRELRRNCRFFRDPRYYPYTAQGIAYPVARRSNRRAIDLTAAHGKLPFHLLHAAAYPVARRSNRRTIDLTAAHGKLSHHLLHAARRRISCCTAIKSPYN